MATPFARSAVGTVPRSGRLGQAMFSDCGVGEASGQQAQGIDEDLHRSQVLVEIDVLAGGMVQFAVPRSISGHGYAPARRDDVHVRAATLEHVASPTAVARYSRGERCRHGIGSRLAYCGQVRDLPYARAKSGGVAEVR